MDEPRWSRERDRTAGRRRAGAYDRESDANDERRWRREYDDAGWDTTPAPRSEYHEPPRESWGGERFDDPHRGGRFGGGWTADREEHDARNRHFQRRRSEERQWREAFVERGAGATGQDHLARSARGRSRDDDLPEREPREQLGAADPISWTYTEVWLIEGPYTGRGPKGYQRSDERLREEVSERLERAGAIDASHIEVSCEGGVVTLEGKVDDRRTKRLAEQCAESVYGVRDVMNRLHVDRGFFDRLFGGEERDDDSASPPGTPPRS